MKPGNQPRPCGPVPTPAGHHLAWQMRATHVSFPGAGRRLFRPRASTAHPRRQRRTPWVEQGPIFTSESVTEGHPDKVCDQISDAVLDAILAQRSRGARGLRGGVTTGLLLVVGEISTACYVDIPAVVRETHPRHRLRPGQVRLRCATPAPSSCLMDEQSPDIAGGVDHALEARLGETTSTSARATRA